MSEINQKEYYDRSAEDLTASLRDLQAKLDEFAKASDLLVSSTPINVRFYNRVNIGLITSDFSDLIKSISSHVAGLKEALKPKSTTIPEGGSSES